MKKENFETLYKQLEQIRMELETGDLPLEKSIELYENGIRIYQECQKRLVAAERKIELLTSNPAGKFETKDFMPSGAPSGAKATTATDDDDYLNNEPNDDDALF